MKTRLQRLERLAFIVVGVVFLGLGLFLVWLAPQPVTTLLQIVGEWPLRVLGVLFFLLGLLLALLPHDRARRLLGLLWKSLEFVLALGVVLIGLLVLLDMLQPRQVAAAFSRVGGPTRVETAVEAARFWVMPPHRVVMTPASAPREVMWGAAQCAMAHDAPLLLTSPSEKRQRLVDRMILDWNVTMGLLDPPGVEEVEVKHQLDAERCMRDGDESYADGLSTLQLPNHQLGLPQVKAQQQLAPFVVFAVAKTPRDAPDVAVALALGAHLATAEQHVSLIVIPRYLGSDPELEKALRERRELVKGGVVLGQTGILPEDTHALLRQVLTSTDRSTFLGALRSTVESLTPLIAALLALVGARAASQVAPEFAQAASKVAPDFAQAASQVPPRLAQAAQFVKDVSRQLVDEGRDSMAQVQDRIRPRRQTEADRRTGLRSGQQVTVWLRSGWRVTGSVNHGKDGADVRAVTFLRLNKAKLARDGYESEQTADMVLVPVEDIELIKADEPAPSGS